MDWLIGAGYGLRVTSCGVRAEAAWLVGEPSTLRQAQCKQAPLWDRQDKFFVFSLTIATILYKYMHIYVWTALRIVVFERGLYGF